jgi:hypothetical protein
MAVDRRARDVRLPKQRVADQISGLLVAALDLDLDFRLVRSNLNACSIPDRLQSRTGS